MHLERLGELLDLYKFSLGSIAYCVDHMRSTLREMGNTAAVQRADTARQALEAARELQYDWDQQKKKDPLEREGTQKLDDRIDQTLTNLRDAAQSYADLRDGGEEAELADEFVEELFPSGVYPITSKNFDDQHAAVNELLGRIDDSFGDHVASLGLEPIVRELRNLNDEFGDMLEPDDDGVTYDEVQEAYNEAEDAFHALVVKVMSDYAGDTDKLNRAIAPVLEQSERARRHLQRRGTVPEVDPETGEPVETEGGGPANSRPSSTADETTSEANSETRDETTSETSGETTDA